MKYLFIFLFAWAIVNGETIVKDTKKELVDEINAIQKKDGKVTVNELHWEGVPA